MRSRTTRTRLVLSLFAATLVFLTGVTAAASSPDRVTAADLTTAQRTELDAQIAHHLKITPGAERVAFNELAWQDGNVHVVLTLPVPGQAINAAADCPALRVCLYEGDNFGYPRQAFLNCGDAAVDNIGVTSWHNNQTNDTESWLMGPFLVNLQSSRALSKVSYVGVSANDRTRRIHVC